MQKISGIATAVNCTEGLVLVVEKTKEWNLGKYCARINARTNGAIQSLLDVTKQDVVVIAPCDGDPRVVVLVGVDVVGCEGKNRASYFHAKGADLCNRLRELKIKHWTLVADIENQALDLVADAIQSIRLGFEVKGQRVRISGDSSTDVILELSVYSEDQDTSKHEQHSALIDGIKFAREVSIAPPNLLQPATYAERIRKELEGVGVEVEILREDAIKQLGMGCLLGVGQASSAGCAVVVMRYNSGGDKPPIGLVGKGVTFDAGGLSLKPASFMRDMKYDMSGSAAVVGAIKSLAASKASGVNVIGVVGLVENMISGNALRPDDVLTSMSRKTVEIDNTDAEGRLVLADLVCYAESQKCQSIVTIATLTGAITVALGYEYAGVFTPSESLASKLITAGDKCGERVYRLPVGSEYLRLIESDIADLKNCATSRAAGSIIGALFIQQFVQKAEIACIDMANMNHERHVLGKCPGWGVQILDAFIRNA